MKIIVNHLPPPFPAVQRQPNALKLWRDVKVQELRPPLFSPPTERAHADPAVVWCLPLRCFCCSRLATWMCCACVTAVRTWPSKTQGGTRSTAATSALSRIAGEVAWCDCLLGAQHLLQVRWHSTYCRWGGTAPVADEVAQHLLQVRWHSTYCRWGCTVWLLTHCTAPIAGEVAQHLLQVRLHSTYCRWGCTAPVAGEVAQHLLQVRLHSVTARLLHST